MSQDVVVKPAFQSAVADSGDASRFGPDAWNAARLFTGGADGEILVRDPESATGASWVSGFWAGGPGANNYAPLILTGLYPGIDLVSTLYGPTTYQRRYQIVNGTQGVLEFNYWTGLGTTIQTGWSMDPNTQEFKSVGNVRGKYLTSDLGSFLSGPTTILEGVVESGRIIPAQLTAATNDWNPPGLTAARHVTVTTNASQNLSGIILQTHGTRLTLLNGGTQNLVLLHDAVSAVGNRLLLPGLADFTLRPYCSVELWYDAIAAAAWRVLGTAQGANFGPAHPASITVVNGIVTACS